MTNWSETLPFTRESVTQHVGKSGGVFRLIVGERAGEDVFYVANSEDLCRSFAELLHGVTYNPGLARCLSHPGVRFRFFPSDNVDERSQVEQIELAKWHPRCNPRTVAL